MNKEKLLNNLENKHLKEVFKNVNFDKFVSNSFASLIIENVPEIETIEYVNLITSLKKATKSICIFQINRKDINILETALFVNFGHNISVELDNDENVIIDIKENKLLTSKEYIIRLQAQSLGFPSNKIIFKNLYSKDAELIKWMPKSYDVPLPKAKNDVSTKQTQNFELCILKELPITQEELNNFPNPNVIIDGEVLNIEAKPVKNAKKVLYLIHLTNYSESVLIKAFEFSKPNFKVGDKIKVAGTLMFDSYNNQVVLNVKDFKKSIQKVEGIQYLSEDTKTGLFITEEPERCEFHLHTKFSAYDGITDVKEYFDNAKSLGLKSITFTDHENVHVFPEAEKLSKETGIKANYGCEFHVVDDSLFKITSYENKNTDFKKLIAVDIETTGFSGVYDRIIEIGAYNVKTKETFQRLIKLPQGEESRLTTKIKNLTGITLDELMEKGVSEKEALRDFMKFIGNGVMISHNATFDSEFIECALKRVFDKKIRFSYIDTLNFAKSVLKNEIKRSFKLDVVAKKLKVELDNHHRGFDDAKCCGEIFVELLKRVTYHPSDSTKGLKRIEIKTSSKKNCEALSNYLDSQSIKYTSIDTTDSGLVKKFTFTSRDFDAKDFNVLGVYSIDKTYYDDLKKLNNLISKDEIINSNSVIHLPIIAKNQAGLKILNKLVTLSHTENLSNHGAVLLISDLKKIKNIKDHLIVGSGCTNGLFQIAFNKGLDELVRYNDLIDYFEIQPLDSYISVSDSPDTKKYIKDCVIKITEYAESNNKPVIVTTDAHYIYPTLKQYYECLVNTKQIGGSAHHLFQKGLGVPSKRLYSTSLLIEQIKQDYGFHKNDIKKWVIKNSLELDSKIENITIIPNKLLIPKDNFLAETSESVLGYKVESVKKEFDTLLKNSLKKYTIKDVLPNYIKERFLKEYKALTTTGYYLIYYVCYLLVKRSNDAGYVVGSRGSVGSSLIANLLGISEVNPLVPHYICLNCNYQAYKGVKLNVDFKVNDKIIKENLLSVKDGYDLKDAVCPCCGKPLSKDGHDIPFETFLGFNGDKIPDIDLNFSGEYQPVAHDFLRDLITKKNAFRAGTVQTIAEKTAYSYLEEYYNKEKIRISPLEISRRSKFITDVKRTTGQHPAGIVIIPDEYEIEDVTPVQYPANKKEGDWLTTHHDYHGALADATLKFDILGHDDPTILKMLMDKVKQNPANYPFNDVKNIPVVDENIFALLQANKDGEIESWGVSEFGTTFVQQMLAKANPKTFADLVKISGLSHGTDVWTTNAEALVDGSTKYGKIPFADVIGCRDDIMVELIEYGLDKSTAFDIMELVRKGKVSKSPEKWEKYKAEMKAHKVPEWYIWSCEKIKYMFPKAHAVAYVTSALRIAWFKAHRPMDYYEAYFSVRSEGSFDTDTITTNNLNAIESKIKSIRGNKASTLVELATLPYLEVAREAIKKGYSFQKPNVNLSDYKKFISINSKTILVPLNAIDGVGENIAKTIVENRKDKPYSSIEDLSKRGKAGKALIKTLEEKGALDF